MSAKAFCPPPLKRHVREECNFFWTAPHFTLHSLNILCGKVHIFAFWHEAHNISQKSYISLDWSVE